MKWKITLAFMTAAFISCDKFEMRGFFTSHESVDHRFEQSTEWNNQNGITQINIPQSTYTIMAFGDSHVGGTRNLKRFLNDARDNNTSAVVMTGDLTTGNKEDYDVFFNHMPLKDSLIYFPIVGNHDLYFEGWKQFYSYLGSSTYYFVINTPSESDLFICLDTGSGTLGNKQLNWFKKLLESDRKNYRHCIVFTHNNLIRARPTLTTNPMVEEVHVLLDLFLRYNVNMVVTGHDHKHNSTTFGNTNLITMDALLDSNDRAGYLKLSINELVIDYRFVKL